jgi:DNA-binding MarR family transcriptional regulator
VCARDLDLPRGPTRERVRVRAHTFELRGSEVRTLATVGAFRVVPASDLRDPSGRPQDPWHGDLSRLRDAGLIVTRPYVMKRERLTLVTLTERGRDLLEARRREGSDDARQAFYAGVVKPRELGHDAQLYRAYLRAAERLDREGVRIRRVVLDYELKRDYQRFRQQRHRQRREDTRDIRDAHSDVQQWARTQDLPVIDGHVHFPDVRIEYEREDGRRGVEDVEVTTPHYRGAYAAAKARTGFTRYRAAAMFRVGTRGGGGRRTPDPRIAEEFL